MLMLLYFSIVGAVFYKLFLTTPREKKPSIPITKPTIPKHEAADLHGG
ncbi:hypothetical protein [Solibacillus sp. FSL H8-0538]